MIIRRSWLIYGTLAAIWIGLIIWQTAEHARVEKTARADLRNRAKDFSNALGVLMRSVRFRGTISRERLQRTLGELVGQGELQSVELRNVAGEVVASAGTPIPFKFESDLRNGELWGEKTVVFENLVDLGTNIVVLTERRPGTNAQPAMDITNAPTVSESANPPPAVAPASNEVQAAESPGTNMFRGGFPEWRGRMTDEQRRIFRQQGGVHDFIIVMSTQSVRDLSQRDLWLRLIIGLLGTISVAGYGLAWRTFTATSELQIRLTRASELNSHLKEMNLAAAGLAHETRNPLNIIRGLAQMISKQQDTPAEIRIKSRDIINEADRVAAQLNEFINYSRPRELRRVPTNLNAVLAEIVRALGCDIEEQKVRVEIQAERLTIEADEQLLRQALFNLVLNAIQAVPTGGEIVVRAGKRNGSGAFVEIADNGPGVPPENRTEIFKPYFTTHQKGTGLGLAVVQQIVSAHGWEVECLPNLPAGALFRISRLKLILRN